MSLSSFMNLVLLVSMSTLQGGAEEEEDPLEGGVAGEVVEEDRYVHSVIFLSTDVSVDDLATLKKIAN